MKRATLAIVSLAALTSVGSSAADSVSDHNMASRYFQAAQAGDSDAEFYTGALYSAGVGQPRSDEEAVRWFSRAANQGHSHAMLILGGLYAIGRGVQKDNVKAYKWAFIVSSVSKTEEFRDGARQLMGLLENKMTPGEINQAKLDANGYHAASATQGAPGAPSTPGIPGTGQIRVLPAPAPPPVAAANTPPAAPGAPAPPAKTSNDTVKKEDLDGMLDRVPQGLRKRFGF
jgi:TPR repeat protein